MPVRVDLSFIKFGWAKHAKVRAMIRVSSPVFIGPEREFILDCLNSGQLSMGAYVKRFEEAFAAFCEVKYAVSCCNGTAALHLALIAVGVKPGDQVIVPALTYIATANAVTYCGAKPLFCDVDPHTWLLDVASVKQMIDQECASGRTVAAIIPVHLYGVPVNISELRALTTAPIIEDAAQAHGAKSDGNTVGSIGDLGSFSFYGNKLLTCGEGGMVTTDSEQHRETLMLYRGQGMSMTRRYWHEVIGFNYRMTELQAAIGLAQLETYHEQAQRRRAVAERYELRLKDKFHIQAKTPHTVAADWMFSVLCPSEVYRDNLAAFLLDHGVETRNFFTPLCELPPYAYARGSCPVAVDVAGRGLNLPTHAGLASADVDYICELLFRF